MSSNDLAIPRATAGFDVNAYFRSAMNELGLSPEDTGGAITFVGEDPIFPSAHRLGARIGIPIKGVGGDYRYLAPARRPRPGPEP